MTLLRTVSQKLQSGTPLTPEEMGRAICVMRGWNASWFSITGFGDKPGVFMWFYSIDGNPFTNTDDAFKFVRELFPAVIVQVESDGGYWACSLHKPRAYCLAPTPSEAIMAACIEAFLAKKGDLG